MKKVIWVAMAALAAVSVEPMLMAQPQPCPQSAGPTIWFDAQRDASGAQALTDVRICLDGIMISAARADIVGDEMVIRGATVTTSNETARTLSRGRRTVLRGDQVQELPQR